MIKSELWSSDPKMCGGLSSVETEEKQDASLFLFGCPEMTSIWLITAKLAYKNAWKALFARVGIY